MSEPTSTNPLEASFLRDGQPRTSRVVSAADVPEGNPDRGSSEWWLQRLLRSLSARNDRISEHRDYYRGENDTWRFADEAHRDTFGDRFKNMRLNLAKPVVESVEQRMQVIGIDLWDDDVGADIAWDLWQHNSLEDVSSEVHLDMLSTGICPVLVDPWRDVVPGYPLISKEDPLQVYVEHDPSDRRSRLAAIKAWYEDDGRRTAVLYLPDRVEWWRTDARPNGTARTPVWRKIEGEGGSNPMGVVPIVEIQNAPRGRAEHADILKQCDDAARVLYQMATTGHYASYPQRWATGVDASEEDVELDSAGRPLTSRPAAAETGPNRAVTAEDPNARFGDFTVSDLMPFINNLSKIQELVAVMTSTPLRQMMLESRSIPSSGEAVRLADLPLTRKVRRRQTKAGDGWETVIRLGFLRRGDQVRARRMDMETAWADPEEHTESEHIDALVKMKAMGVPTEELWRRMGATPQQIRRWRAAGNMPDPVTEGDTDARGTDPDPAG